MADVRIEQGVEVGGEGDPDALDAVDEQLARRARSEGLQLTGEGGLLARLTKQIVESALEGEMDDHRATASMTRPLVMGATRATARAARRC